MRLIKEKLYQYTRHGTTNSHQSAELREYSSMVDPVNGGGMMVEYCYKITNAYFTGHLFTFLRHTARKIIRLSQWQTTWCVYFIIFTSQNTRTLLSFHIKSLWELSWANQCGLSSATAPSITHAGLGCSCSSSGHKSLTVLAINYVYFSPFTGEDVPRKIIAINKSLCETRDERVSCMTKALIKGLCIFPPTTIK